MPNFSVSVIIPTLNEEKLIEQTLKQFTPEIKKKFNLEVIVSDGGSSDATLKKIGAEVDKVVIHNNGIKQNISGGRNKGYDASQGDVLIFFNADTKVENLNLFLLKSLEVLNSDHVGALAYPVKVFPEEEILSDKLFHKCYNFYVRVLNKFFMGMGRGECHCIKREAFELANGYDDKLNAGEDFELYMKIRKNFKIAYMDKIYVYESPRRYRKFGYAKVFYDWAKNSIWITIFKKSLSKEWKPIR